MSAVRYLCALCLLLSLGCTTTKTSNTARTGTEQLLISNAVDQALAKVDFSPMNDKKVLVEEKYMDCTDKGYIISSVRHHIVHAGGTLTTKPEDADIILELRSGGVGTDTSDSYVGMPGLTLPGMVTLPDVKIMTRSRQSAFAKLGIVCIDNKTHQEMDAGGTTLAMSDDNNWYVMGVGPYRQGSMELEVKKSLGMGSNPIDENIPHVVSFRRKSLPLNSLDELSGRIRLVADEEEQPPAATQEVVVAKDEKPAAPAEKVVAPEQKPAAADAAVATKVQPSPAKTVPAVPKELKSSARSQHPGVADKLSSN